MAILAKWRLRPEGHLADTCAAGTNVHGDLVKAPDLHVAAARLMPSSRPEPQLRDTSVQFYSTNQYSFIFSHVITTAMYKLFSQLQTMRLRSGLAPLTAPPGSDGSVQTERLLSSTKADLAVPARPLVTLCLRVTNSVKQVEGVALFPSRS